MKIILTEAQVWWIGVADELRPPEAVNLPDLYEKIQNTFRFFTPPNPAAPVNEGLKFARGVWHDGKSDIPISLMTIFSDGIQITVPSNTTAAERRRSRVATIAQRIAAVAIVRGCRY